MRPRQGHRRRVVKWALMTFGTLALALAALVVFVLIPVGGPWRFTTPVKETDTEVVTALAAGDVQRGTWVANLQAAGVAVGMTGGPEMRSRPFPEDINGRYENGRSTEDYHLGADYGRWQARVWPRTGLRADRERATR